jgi:hypothetical protein
MLKRLAHFLTYNNAVPLTVTVIMVGASTTYAVNNPELLYEETTEIVSIDNTYIASVDLDTFTPYVDILEVTEDEEFYYVRYQKSTIELIDAVWQDVDMEYTLRVRKTRLGQYGDLGVYVTEQLKQVIATELERLRGTQVHEQLNVTQQQRVTTYRGLIGARLDASTETIPGYTPRVRPPQARPEPMRLAGPGPNSTVSGLREIEPSRAAFVERGNDVSLPDDAFATEIDMVPGRVPYLELLGPADLILLTGESYTDFGVAVIDAGAVNPVLERTINSHLVNTVTISTAEPRDFVIGYRLVLDGIVFARAERRVRVVTSLAEPAPVVSDIDEGDSGEVTARTTPPPPELSPAVEEIVPPPPIIEIHRHYRYQSHRHLYRIKKVPPLQVSKYSKKALFIGEEKISPKPAILPP